MIHDPTIPVSEVVRVRLLALIARAGTSPTAVSTGIGKTHSYLARKLGPPSTSDVRPLTTADLDEVLAYLGLPASALLEPVLWPGDRELLGWIASQPEVGRTVRAAGRAYPGAKRALERLAEQLLVDERDEILHLTDGGRACAAA